MTIASVLGFVDDGGVLTDTKATAPPNFAFKGAPGLNRPAKNCIDRKTSLGSDKIL